MDELIPKGCVPSLLECTKLVIEGDLQFAEGVVIRGSVSIKNTGAKQIVHPGIYENGIFEF